MNAITLKTPCYYIDNGEIVEATLADIDRFIETTTRPSGIGPKYYVTTVPRNIDAIYDDDDNEIIPERTDDVWVVAKWVTWGGPEVVVDEYDSEEEANAAAEAIYVDQIMDNNEFMVHLDRESAEEELKSIIDGTL